MSTLSRYSTAYFGQLCTRLQRHFDAIRLLPLAPDPFLLCYVFASIKRSTITTPRQMPSSRPCFS